jgi:hypothetical protein
MKQLSLTRTQLALVAGIYAFLLIVSYALIYQYEPFGDWSRLVLDSITILAALTCAVTLSIIVTFYQRGEPPRQIWIYFALALWMWTIGEVIWGGYDLFMGEVPDPTFADAFYFCGYIFFTLALASQYRLVLFIPGRKIFWIAAGIWLATIAATLLLMIIWKSESFASEFLKYFYPIGDLAVGVAALVLVITFRRGALARPWLSLLAFVFSDTLYLWATSQDLYAWQATGGNTWDQWITLGVETVYLVAYMIMFWGVFQQYLTLRFGAVLPERDTKPILSPKSR